MTVKYSERRRWRPTPVLLPGKSHGRRSLVACSPWGREGSDTTERLPFHFSLSPTGEGNGSPLQCSCLENPRDGGAWWAAVYGGAQSRSRLRRRSSSSPEGASRRACQAGGAVASPRLWEARASLEPQPCVWRSGPGSSLPLLREGPPAPAARQLQPSGMRTPRALC